MKKKWILLLIVILAFLYPGISIIEVQQALVELQDNAAIEDRLVNYQLSIWITWIILTGISIYYKWTVKSNFFFRITYIYLLFAFGVYGYFQQVTINVLDLPTSFSDDYTLGIFVAVQHIVIAAVLTAMLQASVWWFTRRWHRR